MARPAKTWQRERAEAILSETAKYHGQSWHAKSNQDKYDLCAVRFMGLVLTLTPRCPVQHTELQEVIREIAALCFAREV